MLIVPKSTLSLSTMMWLPIASVGFIELDGTKNVWNTNVRMRNDAVTAITRTMSHSDDPRLRERFLGGAGASSVGSIRSTATLQQYEGASDDSGKGSIRV